MQFIDALQDRLPFPLEDLYVPLATIAGFFVCMMLAGQVYICLCTGQGSKPSEKKQI
jgi:hypothetical protein